jgi:hypothetical protein
VTAGAGRRLGRGGGKAVDQRKHRRPPIGAEPRPARRAPAVQGPRAAAQDGNQDCPHLGRHMSPSWSRADEGGRARRQRGQVSSTVIEVFADDLDQLCP